jgi:HEAT repeat protein
LPAIDVARHAIAWLAERGGPAERAMLAARLWCCDPALVKPTARALIALGDHETLAAATDRLARGASGQRSRAARVLECFADPSSVTALCSAFEDRDASVRGAALDALARLGCHPDAVRAVAPLVGDPSPDVRRRAVRVIRRLAGDPDATLSRAVDDVSSTVRREAALLAARLSPERVSRLLSDRDAHVRATAAGRAGVGAEAAVIAALRTDLHPDVRQAAADTLNLLRGDGAGDALVEAALDDRDAVVRAAALRTAHETLGASQLVASLRRRLRSTSGRRRAMALRTLAKLPAPVSDTEVVTLTRDPDPEVRLALLHVGSAVGADARSVCLALSEDADATVRHAAYLALASDATLKKSDEARSDRGYAADGLYG